MSFHRTILAACTVVFATILTSTAFAQCGGCGFSAPVGYAEPVVAAPVYAGGGCGGCCGGCGTVAYGPVVQPAPVMVAPAPITVGCGAWGGCGGCGNWGGCGGCNGSWANCGGWGNCGFGNCGGCGGCGAGLAPTGAYVVNQGPAYSGPGIMVPNGSYSPYAGLAMPGAYPYVGRRPYGYGGYGGYRGYGANYAYGHRYYRRSYY